MFSKELEQSIANLFDQAQDKNLEYLTIEHLLLMLITDYEVRQALELNDVNIATLRENLEEHVEYEVFVQPYHRNVIGMK